MEEKVCVTSGKKKASVRKRPMQFPARHEVEVCRGREVSEAKVAPFSTTVQILFERYLHAILLEYWHPPECQFYKKIIRVVRLERSVCFRITRLMNNQTKSQSHKEGTATTRMLWLL